MIYYLGFLLVVLIVNKQVYIDYVKMVVLMFKCLGVICLIENWGVDVLCGKVMDFYMVMQVKDDEIVVFLWIEWLDWVMVDVVYVKMMDDFEMQKMFEMFFDGMCMMWGGFEFVVDES